MFEELGCRYLPRELIAGIYQDGISRVWNREQRDRLTNFMKGGYLHRTAVGCCRIEEDGRMQAGEDWGWTPAPILPGDQRKASL